MEKNVRGAGMEMEWNIGKSVWDTSHLTCLLDNMALLSRQLDLCLEFGVEVWEGIILGDIGL